MIYSGTSTDQRLSVVARSVRVATDCRRRLTWHIAGLAGLSSTTTDNRIPQRNTLHTFYRHATPGANKSRVQYTLLYEIDGS
jgi:hypothetical protein